MISDKHRCIFVHVPKTGGQSVESFFLGLHGLDWDTRESLLLRHNPDPVRGPERLAHLYASEYTRLGYSADEDFRAYYKFSFVRNPWSRLVSEYKYRLYADRYSFREFVLEGLPEVSDYTDAYRHIVPQAQYLYDDDDNLLVDYVGRFESLQKDFSTACQHLDIDESTLPHRNASRDIPRTAVTKRILRSLTGGASGKPEAKPRRHYADYYDSETREIVTQMYERDIRLFGYSFGA